MKKIIIATIIMLTLAIGALTVASAQSDWEKIDTGFDYILYDMSFPEGQSEIGFAVGSTSTYNGDGIILQTIDGGDTWEQISEDDIPGLEACYFIDLNTGYIGGWDNYFAKTTDGGVSWTETEIDPGIWFIIDMEFWDESNGIVAAWGGLAFVTDDGGDTWTQATGLDDIQDLTYATSDVLYSCGGDENIHKSEDGGLTWSEIYSGFFQWMFLGVEFLNEDFGVVGGEDGKILLTEDGGETWSENNSSFYHLWHGFHIFNEDSIYVAGTPEGIYKTTDGGSTWVDDYPESTYDPAFYKITFTADNNTGFVCGSQGTIMRKEGVDPLPAVSITPEEISFPQTFLGETSETTLTVMNTGNALLSVSDITSNNDIFSVDIMAFDVNPGDFQEVTVTFAPVDEGMFDGILTIETNDPNNASVEVAVDGEGIVETFPIGNVDTEEIIYPQTWVGESVDVVVTIENTGTAVLIVSNIASDNTVFYASTNTLEVNPGNSEEFTVTFEPDDEAYFEGVITIDCNDPVTPVFEINVQGEGLMPMAVISVEDEILFDTTTVNNSTSATLEVWNIGNVNLEVSDITISNAVFDVDMTSFTVEPGNSQDIIVTFSPDAQGQYDETMDIVSNDGGSPATINLSGYGALGTGIVEAMDISMNAYPNPFDNKITIRCSADLNESQSLVIYNMLGGLVKEIKQETSISGQSEFVWKGTNHSDEQVPSGIYFGVLKTGTSEKSIKIIKK